MKFNFRKITAVVTSVLMVGMTAGVAAAANYPAPFVTGGNADVAIVFGTGAGVSALDVIQAGNIQTGLQSFMIGKTNGGLTNTTGEVVSFDTGSTKIFLDTPLNTAKATLTKADLPTLLANTEFSGDSSTKVTQTITIGSGQSGGVNFGRVIFAKQPSSKDDPVVGLSMGDSSNPIYTARVTFNRAVDFTHADSKGEEIVLFGQTFTVASETDGTSLVLLKDADRASLTSDSPTTKVNVGEEEYTVELISASDTSATIKVTNSAGATQTKEIDEAASKRVNGIDVAVTQADESNFKLSASIIVGSKKITIRDNSAVTMGVDDNPIDGTLAKIIGGTTSATELTVTVFRPDSSNDAIVPGNSFIDPVFGSFKVDFAGLSSPLDDTTREEISVDASGDDTLSLTMTDSEGNNETFDFAHVEGGNYKLSDSSGYGIYPYEGAGLSENSYTILGNEEYGHLVQVTRIYDSSSSLPSSDQVKLEDVITGEIYDAVFSNVQGKGTLTVDGKQYVLEFTGNGETGVVKIKYPIGDSPNTHSFVLYPTIQTKNGANVELYEPLKDMDLSNWAGSGVNVSKFQIPDGDGYKSILVSNSGTDWKVGGTTLDTIAGPLESVSISVGKLVYRFQTTGTANEIDVHLLRPEVNTAIDKPAVIVLEGKDDDSDYNAVVIDTENSNDDVGVSSVYFTSTSYLSDSMTLQNDSDLEQQMDWYGVLSTIDTGNSDQNIATLSIPKSQVYANLFIGATDSSITTGTSGTTQLGEILVKDSEVSSVSSKNLIVVGGSCINSVAANLVGGAKCGPDWTTATGVGSGQFLIQSFDRSGKVALLVAGYEAADTVNAVTYLKTKTVDTAIGKKYLGTSSTSATLQPSL